MERSLIIFTHNNYRAFVARWILNFKLLFLSDIQWNANNDKTKNILFSAFVLPCLQFAIPVKFLVVRGPKFQIQIGQRNRKFKSNYDFSYSNLERQFAIWMSFLIKWKVRIMNLHSTWYICATKLKAIIMIYSLNFWFEGFTFWCFIKQSSFSDCNWWFDFDMDSLLMIWWKCSACCSVHNSKVHNVN